MLCHRFFYEVHSTLMTLAILTYTVYCYQKLALHLQCNLQKSLGNPMEQQLIYVTSPTSLQHATGEDICRNTSHSLWFCNVRWVLGQAKWNIATVTKIFFFFINYYSDLKRTLISNTVGRLHLGQFFIFLWNLTWTDCWTFRICFLILYHKQWSRIQFPRHATFTK